MTSLVCEINGLGHSFDIWGICSAFGPAVRHLAICSTFGPFGDIYLQNGLIAGLLISTR